MISKADQEQHDDPMGIDLDLLGILRRRYGLIAVGILIGAVLAAIFFFLQTPIYQSELVVLVGQRQSELATTGTANVERASTIQEEILSTHMELLGSRKIINDAISRGDLDLNFKDVLENLSITKGGEGLAKNASVLKATFTDPDPEKAANVLNALFESYDAYIDSQSRNVGAEAAELIAKALQINEQELNQADQEYRDFIRSIPAPTRTGDDRREELRDVHSLRLAKLEEELSRLRPELAEARARCAVVSEFVKGRSRESLTEADVMAVLTEKEAERLMNFVNIVNEKFETEELQRAKAQNTEVARVEYQRLMELMSREKVLSATVGHAHPSMETLRAEIASIRKFIEEKRASDEITTKPLTPAQMLANFYHVLKNDISALEKREQELLALSDEEAKLAKEMEMNFLLSTSLKSKLERAQTRYDEVFKRLQEINLTSDYAGFSTDLLAMPLPALKPVWPSKIKIGVLGLLLGGVLGMGLALLAEMTDRTFRSPDDLEQAVGASILAHVPRMDAKRLAGRVARDSKLAPVLATFHAPRDSEAETFRILRTSVLYLAKKENKRVFMITSPSPADGKSTTISNLAVSLAQTGKRVLLVDADMRRPTLGKTFGVDRQPGLADYLDGEADWERICHPTEQPHLNVCPEGTATSQPAELLESVRFEQFVASAREHYDIVLIDTPPLLAVADPAIVADVCDGCLMMIRVEKNNRNLVERAREILRDHAAPLLGVVVNSTNSRRRAYGYSAYNYYGKKEYGYVAKYRRYYAAREDGEREIPTSGHRLASSNGHAKANSRS